MRHLHDTLQSCLFVIQYKESYNVTLPEWDLTSEWKKPLNVDLKCFIFVWHTICKVHEKNPESKKWSRGLSFTDRFIRMTSAQALVCTTSTASWLKARSDFHPEDFSGGVARLQCRRPDPVKSCEEVFSSFAAEITAVMSPLLHHLGMLFSAFPLPLSLSLSLSFSSLPCWEE